jgi:hypothetical protein
MPNVVMGNLQPETHSLLKETHFDYAYPGANLKPGTKVHDFILAQILERARLSHRNISTRYASWYEQDKYLTAYKRVDDEEAAVKSQDDRKPVSIVFPQSYAILETLLSYMMSAFFVDPIFRYEGVGPEDVVGAILMEQTVNLHCNKFKVMLNLHTMWRDGFTYGIGPVAPYWKVLDGNRFAGNALLNVDPYKYLPDPNVPADRIQEGEFVGWVNHTNYVNLLAEEADSPDVFNVQYLKKLRGHRTTIISGDNSGRAIRSGEGKDYGSSVLHPIDEIVMYCKIVPADWGLGDVTRPEKWLFRVASDAVVISARSADFEHNKFPLTVCCPDTDGYSSLPLSRMEILHPLQGVLDWLFNSHITNVRKAINDMIVYDPYAITAADLRDPKPGGLIRIRRPLWGKGGVDQYIKQLQVNDITRANISDSNWILEGMQKIGAADDAAMGKLRSGGPDRLTKAEFQGTASGAVSRLERIAKIIGLQAMLDLGEFFAAHTQQMMDEPQYLKVTGDWTELLLQEYQGQVNRGRIQISPDDLNVNYDVLVRDGSIPGGNYSEVWLQMFQMLTNHPELSQSFDLVRIFKHIARNAGAKNVNEFVRRGGDMQAQVMPDEQVAEQVQEGNIIPFDQGQGISMGGGM